MQHKFRNRPNEVEAFQLTAGCLASFEGWPDWLLRAYHAPNGTPGALAVAEDVAGHVFASVVTLEGVHMARQDDWIIRGVAGELYVCKAEIFAHTYEPVVDYRDTEIPSTVDADLCRACLGINPEPGQPGCVSCAGTHLQSFADAQGGGLDTGLPE